MSLVTGSSKTYVHSTGLSCCFRQWKAKSHCNMLHGYALQVEVKFEGDPDAKNWIVDFGSLKPFKAYLEKMFDHTLIVAKDDPEIQLFNVLHIKKLADVRVVEATGCEAFSKMILEWLALWLRTNPEYADRNIRVKEVVVREHAGNSGYTRLPDVTLSMSQDKAYE